MLLENVVLALEEMLRTLVANTSRDQLDGCSDAGSGEPRLPGSKLGFMTLKRRLNRGRNLDRSSVLLKTCKVRQQLDCAQCVRISWGEK